MGTYYSIYAEVRVGNKWYNLNPLFQREDGKLDVLPVMSGRSSLREAYDELEESSYQYTDLSGIGKGFPATPYGRKKTRLGARAV